MLRLLTLKGGFRGVDYGSISRLSFQLGFSNWRLNVPVELVSVFQNTF